MRRPSGYIDIKKAFPQDDGHYLIYREGQTEPDGV